MIPCWDNRSRTHRGSKARDCRRSVLIACAWWKEVKFPTQGRNHRQEHLLSRQEITSRQTISTKSAVFLYQLTEAENTSIAQQYKVPLQLPPISTKLPTFPFYQDPAHNAINQTTWVVDKVAQLKLGINKQSAFPIPTAPVSRIAWTAEKTLAPFWTISVSKASTMV